jgi:hypothetical protein
MSADAVTIDVNDSRTPVLRAGLANLAIPIVLIAIVLMFKALKMGEAGKYWIVAFFAITAAVGARLYLTTASRLVFHADHVEVTRAFSVARVAYSGIVGVRIVVASFTPVLQVSLKSRSRWLPSHIKILGPDTSSGSLHHLAALIKCEFERRGVSCR